MSGALDANIASGEIRQLIFFPAREAGAGCGVSIAAKTQVFVEPKAFQPHFSRTSKSLGIKAGGQIDNVLPRFYEKEE